MFGPRIGRRLTFCATTTCNLGLPPLPRDTVIVLPFSCVPSYGQLCESTFGATQTPVALGRDDLNSSSVHDIRHRDYMYGKNSPRELKQQLAEKSSAAVQALQRIATTIREDSNVEVCTQL